MWILIILHLFLIFGGIFFISPELTVYPYLINHGLIPYQNLIDQHFPLLFYGPLNLANFGVISPLLTLCLFEIVIILTDVFAYLLLPKKPFIFLIFILIQILLGGNTLWIESFVLLFLVGYLYFTQLKSGWSIVVGGIFLSLALGLRPTLLPFLILLIFFTSHKKLKTFLLLATIPLLEIIWLLSNHLWESFTQLMFFNSEVYTKMSLNLPTRNEILIITLAIIPLLLFAYFSKKVMTTIVLMISVLVLGYPRFDLTDLLPLASIVIIFSKVNLNKRNLYLAVWLVVTIIFVIFRRFSFGPTNFYYPKSIYQSAEKISALSDGKSIYLFGGPDQLYQLSNSTPIGDYYLPSLPWYLSQTTFVERQIDALKSNPQGLVVVNTKSNLGGVSLLDYGKPIWQYIQQNYSRIDSINGLEIYENRN